MSDLVGNPEDRFSRVAAQIMVLLYDFQGLNFAIPLVDQVKYLQSLKEIAIEVPEQHAITSGRGIL